MGRLWLAGGFSHGIRCGRRRKGQDPATCQNFFMKEMIFIPCLLPELTETASLKEAVSVNSGGKRGMKIICVVLQSTACSRLTSSSTAVGFQCGAQSSRQSQPVAAQTVGV